MALGWQKERQADLTVGWAELPRSRGHAFYDRLQAVLAEAGFNIFAEKLCGPYYASRRGRPSLPPGRYFRMHLVGYFERIDSERGLEWRCSDSLSLCEFLRLGLTDPVPDHSLLSKMRSRLPLEAHEAVFGWVLERLAEHGLIKGDRIGVDASTMAAFGTAQRLAAWAGLCPANHESADKQKRCGTRKGDPDLKATLVTAAVCAARTNGT
jgi:transposase